MLFPSSAGFGPSKSIDIETFAVGSNCASSKRSAGFAEPAMVVGGGQAKRVCLGVSKGLSGFAAIITLSPFNFTKTRAVLCGFGRIYEGTLSTRRPLRTQKRGCSISRSFQCMQK